jgi:hypothetical protein
MFSLSPSLSLNHEINPSFPQTQKVKPKIKSLAEVLELINLYNKEIPYQEVINSPYVK